jgi:Spy/CpxP family protein refolding chaperone
MTVPPTRTSGLLSALLVAFAFAGGLAFAQEVDAAPGSGMGDGMQGGGGHGKGMQGGGMHSKGMHGGGYGRHGKGEGKHGMQHCRKHLFGDTWKKTLTAEQEARLDQLHVNFAKIKAPLKARTKALKIDLAILVTAPQPDKAVIDAKIAELLKLKGQMMGAKYGYIAAQRQVLTPQQQVSFDMDTIHKAMHGKKGKQQHGGGH